MSHDKIDGCRGLLARAVGGVVLRSVQDETAFGEVDDGIGLGFSANLLGDGFKCRAVRLVIVGCGTIVFHIVDRVA